jgi:hypothetical protein
VPFQVELYGPPFTGKTATLMHIAINGILPRSLGGNSMTVTWVDCDGRFSLPRFQEMALARAQQAMPAGSSSQAASALVDTALQSLRLYSLPSTRHLLELLRRINEGETQLPGGLTKQMLIIDPISAYYWIDAMESSDELRIFKHVCQQIALLDMAIFVAKSPLYARRERDSHREYLGESWARLVKYRFVLWPNQPCPPRGTTPGHTEQQDMSQQRTSIELRTKQQQRQQQLMQPQRRRPLAPELAAAGAESPHSSGGVEQHASLPCFGVQRLLPAGSSVIYTSRITTAGIAVLGSTATAGTAIKSAPVS